MNSWAWRNRAELCPNQTEVAVLAQGDLVHLLWSDSCDQTYIWTPLKVHLQVLRGYKRLSSCSGKGWPLNQDFPPEVQELPSQWDHGKAQAWDLCPANCGLWDHVRAAEPCCACFLICVIWTCGFLIWGAHVQDPRVLVKAVCRHVQAVGLRLLLHQLQVPVPLHLDLLAHCGRVQGQEPPLYPARGHPLRHASSSAHPIASHFWGTIAFSWRHFTRPVPTS